MRPLLTFLKGPGLIILVLIVFFVAFYFIRHRREAAAAVAAAAAKNTPAKTLGNVNPEQRKVQPGSQTMRETVQGNVIVPATSNLPDNETPVVRATPTPPPVVTRAAAPPPPRLPKLIQSYSAEGPAPLTITPPKLFAPSGTLIKCSLVLTVDSSSLQTPVLAEITEDVWQNKKLIIPAGTLAYGFAGKGHVRDRIDVSGTWDLIFKDGREYQLRGLALDREVDTINGGYGLTDGSAGIKGQVLESDEYGDLKIFLATAIGAVANNSLQTTNQGFGNSITNSAQNVPLQGGQAVLDRYARRIEESQEGDGTYVRVSAGTEFYIFPLNVVEPQLASVAGLTQGGKPKNSWDLARDSYDAQQADDASRRAPTAEDAQRQMVQGALQQREAAMQQVQSYLNARKSGNAVNPAYSYPSNAYPPNAYPSNAYPSNDPSSSAPLPAR